MKIIASLFAVLSGLIHVFILVMEMFFWDHPFGRKVFNVSEQLSSETIWMALNQGLYNGFLAAGIFIGLAFKKRDVLVFSLVCIVVAGIFGAITIKPTILFVQSLPASLALLFMWLSRSRNT